MQQVRLLVAWQTYSKGTILTPTGIDRQWLIASGYAEPVQVEVEAPSRPARLTRAAAAKIVDGTKKLFG